MNILGMFFLATLIEGLLTYLTGTKNYEADPRKWIQYVALAFGILLAIVYNLDILKEIGLTTTIPFISFAITGIIIGRGSNYLNDIVTLIGTKVGKK